MNIKKLFSRLWPQKRTTSDSKFLKEAKASLLQLDTAFSGVCADLYSKLSKKNLPSVKLAYFDMSEIKWKFSGNHNAHYTLKQMTSSSFLHEYHLFHESKGDLGFVVIKQLEREKFEVIFVSRIIGETAQRTTFSDWEYLFMWLTEISKWS